MAGRSQWNICIVFVSVLVVNALAHDNDTGYFWQITDIHLDFNYSVHGNPYKFCWTNVAQSGAPPLGEFGDYRCDSPWTLVISAVKAMQQFYPNPDFVIWTGDSIPHIPNKEFNFDKLLNVMGNVTALLLESFPNVSFFPALGNHDWWPAHQYPPDSSPYYDKMLTISHWSRMLPQETCSTFRKGGFYTQMMMPGVRLISINSNLWYFNDHLTLNMTDPRGQIAWLEAVLAQSRANKEKVFMIGHIPPGFMARTVVAYFDDRVNKHFLHLLIDYADIITSQLYGHEHTDGFHVIYNKDKPVGVTFMAPAVTPWNKINNPTVRLYRYNKSTGQVLDMIQYYLNLSAANAKHKADWQKEYQASEAYGIADITPESMHKVALSFSDPTSKNFDKYYLYNSGSYDTTMDCNSTCRRLHICSIRYVDYDDYGSCVMNTSAHVDNSNDSKISNFDTVKPIVSLGDNPENKHHHKPDHGKRHVPRFMHFVIIGLVVFVIILFLLVTILCLLRRRKTTIIYPRYVMLA